MSSTSKASIAQCSARLVHGKRGITADTAIRLARYFGTSDELWMNLQSNYELRLDRRALRDKVSEITPLIGVSATS